MDAMAVLVAMGYTISIQNIAPSPGEDWIPCGTEFNER